MSTAESPQQPSTMVSSVFADLYPKGSVASTLAADGQVIRYEEHGQGDCALVLVHGGLCDRSYWAEQVEGLSRHHRVITLDLPGHGESGRDRQRWSIGAFGQDVVSVIDAAKVDKAVVVGHSMGGAIAVEAARMLGRRAAGVVAVDTFHAPLGKAPAAAPPPLPQDEGAYRAALTAGLQRGMFTTRSDPRIQRQIIDAMVAYPREVAGPLREAFAAYDAPRALKDIGELPLTLIQSGLRTTDVDDIRQLHRAARIFVLGTAGHFLMLEQPQAFNALLLSEIRVMKGVVHPL